MTLDGHSVNSPTVPLCSHEFIFLKLVVSGAVIFDDFGDTLSVRNGSMVLVDPDRRFCETFVAPTDLLLLMLPKREMRERGLVAEVDRPLLQDSSSPENTLLWHLLLTIAQHAKDSNDQFKERLGTHIMDLVDHLICTTSQHHSSRTAATTCARIKWYLRQHLGESSLDTATVAGAMRLSARSISRLFAAEGTTLMRYLWSCRLERAQAILSGAASLSIEQVAWRCGFSDATHFSRSFKSRFGCSPREHRRISVGTN
jgi:transcriptional regulator GlxA family with amidase domain